MVLTGRLKVLLALGVAVVGYILYTAPDESGDLAAPAARHAGGGKASARKGGSSSSPLDADASPSAPSAASAATGSRNVSSAGSEESARLFARLSNRVTDGGSAGALFKPQSWYTPPPPPPPAPVAEAAPPPAPTAPPVPFSVMGRYARAGERTTYFLTRGDRVFDVHVGDTIDNTYSVDGDNGGQLQLTYKPLNIKQALPIGGSQ